MIHECRECRFGLRDEPWTDIRASSHTWSDLACFGSGSAVGSGFGSLGGKGTGSGGKTREGGMYCHDLVLFSLITFLFSMQYASDDQ